MLLSCSTFEVAFDVTFEGTFAVTFAVTFDELASIHDFQIQMPDGEPSF